jgi:hypothetical protein
MNALPTTPKDPLLVFNLQVLGQALALVQAHQAGPVDPVFPVGTVGPVGPVGHVGRPRYAGPAGSHLRHIIEHYEALVFPRSAHVVDYDQRPRDRELEVNPARASARLNGLQDQLQGWHHRELLRPVQVHGQGGTAGEFGFQVMSSIGRELAFVASHAVHHFALLLAYCQQHHIATPTHFGKAPATVAHERATAAHAAMATTTNPQHQESPCFSNLHPA